MKTILIIEHDIVELETLMDICRLGSKELTILSAQDEDCARTTLSKKRVDLILCSPTFPNTKDCQIIARLSQEFPYIPLIGVALVDSNSREQALALGASGFYKKPFKSKELMAQINKLVERSSTGTMKGIPIHSFLQMLENEEKSCTLQIFGSNTTGFIYINDGVLIDAETGSLNSEEAVYEIISWNEVIIEIKFFNGQRQQSITKPLISLIMEGFRLKDEREEKKKQEQTIVKPQHKLKQISTAGHRLALDIGLRLKMEFNSIDTALDSVLIGMVQDSCLIAATPSHFIITQTEIAPGSVVLIKFIYMGNLCLFKSKLIKAIKSPLHMLFLEFPSLIHYHEMRKTKRTAIYVPCTLDLPNGGRYFGAFIDLSSAGGLCHIKTKGNEELPGIAIKQNVEINCILPGLMEEQHITGTIRNFKTNSQEIRIGIEFSSLHTYLKETIRQYLYTVENEHIFKSHEIEV